MHALFTIALAAGLAAPAPMAAAGLAKQEPTQTMSGVTMPAQVEVGSQALTLNGIALRKKAIFKVYVAGLYLPARNSDADQILAADEPRHLVMQFVRNVDAKKMCDAWNDGLAANTPNASEELKGQFGTLCGYMEDIEKQQQFVFSYLPGHGTDVSVKGNLKGTLEGKEFADALFRVWLGPRPGPGEGFKKNLLGKEKEAS